MAKSYKNGLKRVFFDSLENVGTQEPGIRGKFLIVFQKQLTNLDWFADGYLKAANALVQEIYYNSQLRDDDTVVFPALFLFVHALEIHMKEYLRKLIEHRSKKTCHCIPAPSGSVSKLLAQHELKPIFKETLHLVNHSKLHGNQSYADLEVLINEIAHYGISVDSLRYSNDRAGVAYPLLGKQRWVFLGEMNLVMDDACRFLERARHQEDFYLCEAKEFKKPLLKEFKYTLELLKKLEQETRHLQDLENKEEDGCDGFQIDLEDFRQYFENLSAVEAILKEKSDNELLLLSRGIRFGKNSPITIPNKESFTEWGRVEQARKTAEDIHHIRNAIKQLKRHIEYVESRIAIRE